MTKDNLQKPSRFGEFYNSMGDFVRDLAPSKILAYEDFKIDVRKTENEYKIDAELPGVKKEEISVKLDDGNLTITVQKEERIEEEQENYVHREIKYGKMERSFFLESASNEEVSAKFENGLLQITIAKVEKPDKSTKIEIK